MSLYFLVHDAAFFHGQVRPALAAAWRQRSFEPCCPLGAALQAAVQAFAERYQSDAQGCILSRVDRGLPFDRDIWRLLVGEVLLYGAREVPEIETAPEALTCLLAPDRYREGEVPRERFAPIQQAHFGSRDLVFGTGYYRPEQAGWNNLEDVARLAEYLGTVNPGQWTEAGLATLAGVGMEEQEEELAFVRDWFPLLVDLYRWAREQGCIIICEDVWAGYAG